MSETVWKFYSGGHLPAVSALLQRRASSWTRKGRCRNFTWRMILSEIDFDFGVMRRLTDLKVRSAPVLETTTI
ncbi:hypothetical protein MPL3356_40053 [Mesorhizobium plurifarium]|uniref:Uncharacterized protein n=1 Tax=Mesorhizobium plurifarium TaxID=69974 RepID=A0A090FYN6_MESPL|nr:hypothetical protein MPL3356_40053 [Mesorhizobium plurifarium]CDX52513.1 hypothetical protein MPL3365_150199 [Mesorhizobium plurifarium]